jgi:hypothetical protein
MIMYNGNDNLYMKLLPNATDILTVTIPVSPQNLPVYHVVIL